MSSALPRAEGEATRPRELVMVTMLRTVVSPALALILGRTLGLDHGALLAVVAMAALPTATTASRAVVAMAALPTAQNVIVYATQYGRGQVLARDAGMVTTTLAVPVLLIIAVTLG